MIADPHLDSPGLAEIARIIDAEALRRWPENRESRKRWKHVVWKGLLLLIEQGAITVNAKEEK